MYIDAATGNVSYKLGVMDKARGVAYGFYNSTLNVTGWGVLEIRTAGARSRGVNDTVVMFAAGYLEGLLTAR